MNDATMPRALADRRAYVHAATGLPALLLGVLPAPWHLVAAGLGVLSGLVLFPLMGWDRSLRRADEPFWGGLRTYPIAVFLLVLLLPRGQAIGAWGVLAFGDAAASWVGRRLPEPRLFGHAKASWPGTLAFLAAGWAGALALWIGGARLAAETGEQVDPANPGALAWAVLAGALADLLPWPREDNLRIAAAAGSVLVLLA